MHTNNLNFAIPIEGRAQLPYFTDGERGAGGVRGIFWGLKVWPKGIQEFFGSMKYAGISVLGREKNTWIFGDYCTFHQLKSTITFA